MAVSNFARNESRGNDTGIVDASETGVWPVSTTKVKPFFDTVSLYNQLDLFIWRHFVMEPFFSLNGQHFL